MTRAEYRKALSLTWVAAGKCSNCGRRPRRKERKLCERCARPPASKAEYRKAIVKRWRDAGLCPSCGRPPADQRKLCAKCLERSLIACRKRRVAVPDEFREQYHILKALGVCTVCRVPGKPLVTASVCEGCWLRERQRSVRVKSAVMQKYGGKCFCCGEERIAFLTIDHANDDGASRRKAGDHGGSRYYEKLVKDPLDPTLRVACYNCNCARRVTGICPHQDNGYFEQALARGKYSRG